MSLSRFVRQLVKCEKQGACKGQGTKTRLPIMKAKYNHCVKCRQKFRVVKSIFSDSSSRTFLKQYGHLVEKSICQMKQKTWACMYIIYAELGANKNNFYY